MTSDNITQEEVEAYARECFTKAVMDEVDIRTVKMLFKRKKMNLLELSKPGMGQYDWKIGKHCKYSYHRSDMLHLLEALYDAWLNDDGEILFIETEFNYDLGGKPMAKIDPDTEKPFTAFIDWEDFLETRWTLKEE